VLQVAVCIFLLVVVVVVVVLLYLLLLDDVDWLGNQFGPGPASSLTRKLKNERISI
jgi:hypothetical protein